MKIFLDWITCEMIKIISLQKLIDSLSLSVSFFLSLFLFLKLNFSLSRCFFSNLYSDQNLLAKFFFLWLSFLNCNFLFHSLFILIPIAPDYLSLSLFIPLNISLQFIILSHSIPVDQFSSLFRVSHNSRYFSFFYKKKLI